MTDFHVQVEGFQRAIDELNDMLEQLESDDRWIVGTGVEYAIYLEFGTSKMDPKPFFRPAVNEARQQGIERFIEDYSNLEVEAIENLDSLVAALALALERRVKQIITEKGLIDTGTLRASVAAIPGGDPANLATEADMPDTDSGPPYPADFGPEARQQIEVNG